MEKRRKLIKLVIAATVSGLFSILVFFSIANGVSYFRKDFLKVEGPAEIKGLNVKAGAIIEGAAAINTTGQPTGIATRGKVGIGEKFFGPNATSAVYSLDVDGIVNANGFFKEGRPLVFKSNCTTHKDRDNNPPYDGEWVEMWCGSSNPGIDESCVPFLVKFNQNDNDPDQIRNVSCNISQNRLYIHTDTTGNDDDEDIGGGSICGAVCVGFVDVGGSSPSGSGSGTGVDCYATDPALSREGCFTRL